MTCYRGFREGDSVTVLSFDRLARSTKQLLSISEQLETMGVDLISLKESVDTTTPAGKTSVPDFLRHSRIPAQHHQKKHSERASKRRKRKAR